MGLSQTPQALVPAAFTSGGMTLLSTTTLSGSSTTISSISQDYVNLLILLSAVNLTNATGISLGLNATNQQLGYTGTATAAFNNAPSNSQIQMRGNQVNMLASNTDNIFSVILHNYSSSTLAKSFLGTGYFVDSNQAYSAVNYGGGTTLTTAVSSLSFTTGAGTFNGGTVLIYGVK
jgi:hypothetical protein